MSTVRAESNCPAEVKGSQKGGIDVQWVDKHYFQPFFVGFSSETVRRNPGTLTVRQAAMNFSELLSNRLELTN